jgi:hypothetical protein
MIFYKSKKSFIEISETVCNTNARFEQLPTVLQQYKSTDEKIFLLLLLLDLQRHNNELHCNSGFPETERNQSTSFKTLQTSIVNL